MTEIVPKSVGFLFVYSLRLLRIRIFPGRVPLFALRKSNLGCSYVSVTGTGCNRPVVKVYL
jgi:hypothetical protein